MDKSRSSLFGIGAAVVAIVAASRVKPAEAAEFIPRASFAIGEVREFFSHFEAGAGVADCSHTHAFSYGHTNSPHSHQFTPLIAVPVTKKLQWDGAAWVDLA
jgi:hypothetical protein